MLLCGNTYEHPPSRPGSSLSGGPIEGASDVRSLLARGTPIRLTVLAGARPSGASPIFGLADSQGDHVLLLSQEGDTAVLHTRDIATALRLNARDVRIPAALAGVEAGDSLTLELEALRSPHPCLVVNGRRRCAPAPSAGSAWALLAFRESWSAHTYAALDALTLFVLLVPVGFLLPTTPGAIRAVGLGLIGLGVPAAAVISGLAAPGAFEVWGALGGLLAGWAAGRAWLSRATRRASR